MVTSSVPGQVFAAELTVTAANQHASSASASVIGSERHYRFKSVVMVPQG